MPSPLLHAAELVAQRVGGGVAAGRWGVLLPGTLLLLQGPEFDLPLLAAPLAGSRATFRPSRSLSFRPHKKRAVISCLACGRPVAILKLLVRRLEK